MQADQTVLSLRPGGGNRGNRVLGPRFESSAFGSSSNSDLPILRPYGGLPSIFTKTGDSRFEGRERVQYTRDHLLQLREVGNVPEDILKIKREVEVEFFGEDQSWSRGESNVHNQSQGRYSELDNRDWRGRAPQFPPPLEDKSWDTIRENREFSGRFESRQQEANQYNARAQISSNQGDIAAPRVIPG
ncbi:unnamed protein product [Ilex paraguariensis]|uniref:Uncharacterized protein n=1 Tax=Ilex paraguariensis TaxID=185542 RepID=A0ABC8THK7_9AQUA